MKTAYLYNLSPNRGTWKTLKALCFFSKRWSTKGGQCAYCFANQTTIARLIHISERQVRRSIQTLVALKIGIYERDPERRGRRFVFSDGYQKQAIALGWTLSKIERGHIATWEPSKRRNQPQKRSEKMSHGIGNKRPVKPIEASCDRSTRVYKPKEDEQKKNIPNRPQHLEKGVLEVHSHPILENIPLTRDEKITLSNLGTEEEVDYGIRWFLREKATLKQIKSFFSVLRHFILKAIKWLKGVNTSQGILETIPTTCLDQVSRASLQSRFSSQQLEKALSALTATYGTGIFKNRWWDNPAIKNIGALIASACQREFSSNLSSVERRNLCLNWEIVEAVARALGSGNLVQVQDDTLVLKTGQGVQQMQAKENPLQFLRSLGRELRQQFEVDLSKLQQFVQSEELNQMLKVVQAELLGLSLPKADVKDSGERLKAFLQQTIKERPECRGIVQPSAHCVHLNTKSGVAILAYRDRGFLEKLDYWFKECFGSGLRDKAACELLAPKKPSFGLGA